MKKKKSVFIVLGVILALALIAGIFFIFQKDNGKSKTKPEIKPETVSSEVSVTEPIEDIESTDTSDKIKDDGTGMSPDESKADKVLQEKKQEIKKSKQTVNTPIKTNEKTKQKYVQDADPKTGISWDGKSKIIYRTIDGDTTVPTYGGYYEIRPDEWVLYEYPTEYEEYDDKCSYCGRVSGDGTHGTCIRYSLIDEDMKCPNCGKTIPAKTCHTCEGG